MTHYPDGMVDFPWSEGDGRILIKQRSEPIRQPNCIWIIHTTPRQVADFESAVPGLLRRSDGALADHMAAQIKDSTSWGASGTLYSFVLQVGADFAITAALTWLYSKLHAQLADRRLEHAHPEPEVADDTARYWIAVAYGLDGPSLRKVGSIREQNQFTITFQAADGVRYDATIY